MKTNIILTTLHVLAWILFVGICIKTGVLIFSLFITLLISGAENLHKGINLSSLYDYSIWHYVALSSLLIFISGLKAYLFYLAILIFRKLNLVNPFSTEVSEYISKISYTAIKIGLFLILVGAYCKWLVKKGINFEQLNDLLGGASEYLVLGGIIFMIAQVFKRGLEIQTENELTI